MPVPLQEVEYLQSDLQIPEEAMDEGERDNETRKVESAPTNFTPFLVCPEHSGKEAEVYCETCEEIVCLHCIQEDEKHHGHVYEKLDKALKKVAREVTLLLAQMEEQLMTIGKGMARLNVCRDEISSQQVAIEREINSAIRRCHEELDIRRIDLISQLYQLTHVKLKNLAAQRNKIEHTQSQLSSCLYSMRVYLKAGNQVDFGVVRQVKEMINAF